MTLSHSAVDSLFRLGRLEEIAADGATNLREVYRLASIDHQLVLAESMARTGRLEAARSIARLILSKPECSRGHARCEMILGIVSRDLGLVDEALQYFRHSVHLAREHGDTPQAASSALSVYRVISQSQPPEVARSLLAEVRGLTTRAADPHLTTLLHESVARHEAQLGNLDEARRHLRIANSLLTVHPNAWLHQLCEINAFCIEFSNCELRLAEEHLGQAKKLATIAGTFGATVTNNFGHLYLQAGKFGKAEQTLGAIVESDVDEVRRSALDGLARLYLATGRLLDCERALDVLAGVRNHEQSATSFPARSSLVTRTRLLLRQGKWHEATVAANAAIEESKKVVDRATLATALMLRAQATAGDENPAEASRSICSASLAGAWRIREHLGMFAQINSRIQQPRSPLGLQSSRRAQRIWRGQGNGCAEREFGVDSTALETQQAMNTGSEKSKQSEYRLASSLATAFDLAYDPSLFGAELLEAIMSTACSQDVHIEKTRSSRTSTSSSDSCRLRLDNDSENASFLVCRIPDDPVKAIALSDILRLGQAALDLERAREEERNRAALWPADPIESQSGAIFLAEETQSILGIARRIAPTNVPVLITGETGTGKEILARTIHAYSARAQNTFLPFNCASTPKDMLDSQLFGHRRGAFTGAVEHHQGVVRAAAGGTLFLDEIGDASLEVQPKLLRFLESNEIHPIGETHPTRVDVRVIVATNADLDALVSQGRFREDLFYRLSIVRLHLPPLRERRVEIPTLANHYLQKHAHECGKGDLRLAEETMEYLVLYKWPGNVRQLANEMRRLAALAEAGAVLMPEHLSPEIAASRRTIPASQRVLEPTEVVVRLDQPMAAAIQHLEQSMMQYALKKCGGRMEQTAAMLGLSRKGLYLKRQRFGIEPPPAAAAATA